MSGESITPGGYLDVALNNTLDLDYDYDSAGCLEYVKDGDTGTKLFQYVYDDDHRLIRVVNEPDGDNDKVVEFVYDAGNASRYLDEASLRRVSPATGRGGGRRVEKIVYADENTVDTKTRYIYAGQNVIEEYVDDSGWVLEAEYVHGIGIDNVLTIERDSTTWYYHHDGLGSVTEITDSNGDLVQAYEYDAWGNPTIYNPDDITILSPYMYTGRRWDPEIALYYYRARYYDPQHGRFTQPDPSGYADGPNLYTYVTNRPTTAVDPAGRFLQPVYASFSEEVLGVSLTEQHCDCCDMLKDAYMLVSHSWNAYQMVAPLAYQAVLKTVELENGELYTYEEEYKGAYKVRDLVAPHLAATVSKFFTLIAGFTNPLTMEQIEPKVSLTAWAQKYRHCVPMVRRSVEQHERQHYLHAQTFRSHYGVPENVDITPDNVKTNPSYANYAKAILAVYYTIASEGDAHSSQMGVLNYFGSFLRTHCKVTGWK